MLRKAWILSFPAFLMLSSCFVSRKATPPEARIPIMDPVVRTIDTTIHLTIDTSARVIPDTLDVVDSLAIDTLIQDTLVIDTALEVDSLQVEKYLKDTICIIGTGDIMPGTNYPDARYLPPGDNCGALFLPVKDILQAADVTFGNLEGVFCSEDGTPKNCKDPKVCYTFRMPDHYLDCILDAGYDVLSVANNHVNDFGYVGRLSTARRLQEAGVPFAGLQGHTSAVFTLGDVTYGFAAFAPHSGTVDLKDYRGAADIVAGLDSVCDIVIVSFHGGAEGRDYQHVPCTDEEYLGYNRGNVCKLAHAVVDAGADVVFGHGPHVTRAMELYNERLICYSLGNFCTYARFNLSGPNGIAPIVKVFTDRDGKFLGGEVVSVYQPGEGGPHIDSQHRAAIKLRDLSLIDFPQSKLVIGEDGMLSIQN